MAKKKSVKKVARKPYHDPLHIPSARYVVVHKGKEVMLLNKGLLDRQNCWENLEAIKAMHVNKLEIYDLINETEDPITLKMAAQQLTAIEFLLSFVQGVPVLPLSV